MTEKAEKTWLCFLDRDPGRTFLLLVEEEPVRRAHALYREGRLLEAADALKEAEAVAYEIGEALWDALYDAVPDTAWRATGVSLAEESVLAEWPGEAVLLLRGGTHEKKKMPMALLSWPDWEDEARPELHPGLIVDEELLSLEPFEGLPE